MEAAVAARTPVFTVPVGAAARLADVAVVDVVASSLVSVGDTAQIAVTIESQGFDNRTVKVELRDGATLLDSKDLVLRGSEQQQVELAFHATEPGVRYLTVQVPPLPEEPEHLRANNTDTAVVRVSDEKIKVLYVEGPARWDYRFLRNAMKRDHGLGGVQSAGPDIVLEAEWRAAGRPPEQRRCPLPRTLDQLAKYHTVILGDASPRLLDPAFINLLDQAVRERGVGLIVEAGPLAMPHAYNNSPSPPAAGERGRGEGVLPKLLPVRLRGKVSGLEAPAFKPFRLELSPEGALHEALRFFDDPGKNQNAWTHLPPYYWCAPVERPAPAASVLVWNPSLQGDYGKLPLVASHYAGQGKVMFIGTDSTWLWRQNVGDRFFYRFWGQAIRFVARHGEAGSKKSWLEVRPGTGTAGRAGPDRAYGLHR